MKSKWISILGSLVAAWSAAELVYDAVRGNPFEIRNVVFVAVGVALVVGQRRRSP